MGRWCSITSAALIAALVATASSALAQSGSAPLPPGWESVPFANGCAYASLSTDRRPTVGILNWYGGCRFGLAHGNGYLKNSNGTSGQRRYYYGVPLGTADGGTPATPYFYRSNDGFDLSMIDETGRRSWVHIQRPDLNVSDIVAGYVVILTAPQGSIHSVNIFTPKPLTCSDRGKVDWKGLTVSATDAAAADADCARYWAVNRTTKPGLFDHIGLDVAYIEHVHWTRPDGGAISPKETTARYCSGGSKSADCTRVLREMLQPYAAGIQRVIDGQRRQYAEGLPWLGTRFASLETDFRRKIQSMAARYAASGSPVSSAMPTQRPPARRGLRK
jgi:hypothetical protein